MSSDLYQPPWRGGNSPVRRLVVGPTQRFMQMEAAGGIVLVIAAVIGLIWANTAHDSYESFWHTHISVDAGIHQIEDTLGHFINGALMVVFFLVVGAEIKREAVHGELRDLRQAALPIVAAIGGMVLPALVFTGFNAGGPGASGWGIPVATDIAFALGVLALLGPRIPIQLKIFLLTLAVADDVGGIMIIAIFYSDEIDLGWLGGAGGALAYLLLVKRLGFRHFGVHALGGFFLWLTFWESGVEATLAGVILGLIVPSDSLYDREGAARRIDYLFQRYRHAISDEDEFVAHADSEEALRSISHVAHEARSPLERVEEEFTRISAFIVVPIFALSNAGVFLGGGALDRALDSDVAWGIFAGLLAGKLIGVLGAAWIAIRLGIAALPPSLNWIQLAGAALLAGIGFTVAIFIATLSFDDPVLAEEAKIGIFAASILAAVLGYLLLRYGSGPRPAPAEAIVERAAPAVVVNAD